LGHLVFVGRRLGHAFEQGLVLFPSNEGFFEIGPIGEAFSDGLLSGLGIMERFEAVESLGFSDEDFDIGEAFVFEPSLAHEERTAVIELRTQSAEEVNL
jgi:hypothetical protein